MLLNDPTYFEAARVFATRLIQEGGESTGSRLELAFELAVARQPASREAEVLTDYLVSQKERYASDEEAAKKITSAGEHPQPEDIEVAELAAWTSVSRVILNLHETITRN